MKLELFVQDLLVYIMSFLDPKNALSFSLTNKLLQTIFVNFYKDKFPGFSMSQQKLDTETINKILYTKIRLPLTVNSYDDFKIIMDIEQNLHSITEPKQTESIINSLKQKYAFIKNVNKEIEWQWYYAKLFNQESKSMIFYINDIEDIYNHFFKIKNEVQLFRLITNHTFLAKKMSELDFDFAAQFQINAWQNSIKNYVSFVRFISGYLEAKRQLGFNSEFYRLLYKSNVGDQYLYPLLKEYFQLFAKMNAEEQFSCLPTILKFLKLFSKAIAESNQKLSFLTINNDVATKKLKELHTKSDLDIKIFFIGILYKMNPIANYLKAFLAIGNTIQDALKLYLNLYKLYAADSQEAHRIRPKIIAVYKEILQRDLNTVNLGYANKTKIAMNKLHNEAFQIFPLWKSICDWCLANLPYDNRLLVALGELHIKFVGNHLVYLYLAESKNEKISAVNIALDYFRKYLKSENPEFEYKRNALNKIAELHLKDDASRKDNNYLSSIIAYYDYIKFSRNIYEQFDEEVNVRNIITKIASILVMLEDPQQELNNSFTRFILSHEKGRDIVQVFSKTERAETSGFNKLIASKSKVADFQTKLDSAMQEINDGNQAFITMAKDLQIINGHLNETDRTENVELMTDVVTHLKNAHTILLNAAKKITEFGKANEYVNSHLKCVGFFKTKSEGQKEEAENSNKNEAPKKKGPAAKKRRTVGPGS